MGNQVKKLLVETRDFISDKQRWTQNATAKKIASDGYPQATQATDPDACQWCASGAVEKVFEGWGSPYWGIKKCAISALDMASGLEHNQSIIGLNDYYHTTHEQVLAAFDKAIERVS